ncbi:hypothetical protein LOAG_10062 [Loa loa]|uniref:Uncharacterized protein n=1 Tax=Loa loa TaxID=7209 RepID=A0A1I7VT39_LOALO|nr:hypothetical protein LOAG_10062 [Loa loa]EFO18432.2 hypothetical protein LOAG_10062 [Loa loa]
MRLTFTLLFLVVAFDVQFVHTLNWRFNEGLDESMAMLRNLRAKEISPPSYMKRFEREPTEQLLQHIWLNILHPRILRHHDLSQPLFYLPLWKEG